MGAPDFWHLTMSAALPDDFNLPPLREDLRIEAAAPLASGAPAWVIYDPVRHRYFQIGQRVVEILSRWTAGTVGALRDRLGAERGFRPEEPEIRNLLSFLFNNELTAVPVSGRSRAFADKAAMVRRSSLLALAKIYLFFRVPLVRPERFLQATMPIARLIYSRGFVSLVVLAGLVGLALSLRQFDAFLSYAGRFISLEGAATYAVAIAFVKVFHELGHAYQATLRNVRVTSMGVAFMVMFPLLYTDVSDAWRRRDRRDKLMIDAGGVLMELGLAAVATLLWVFLPDGPLRMAVFAIATTSWVLSLFVNLNPFMRFDGYYFLSDATGIQNLQPRGFAMFRWRLREALFGLGDTPPERTSAGTRRFMCWYAAGTMIYRLFLFIGIALIVYNLFFKALGILLFAVEILFFVLLPVMKEIGVWFSMRGRILRTRRTWITGGLLVALLAFLLIPMPVTVRAPAILVYQVEAEVYPNVPGQMLTSQITIGATVSEGDVLATIASPETDAEIAMTAQRIELLQLRLARGASDAEEKAEARIYQRQLEAEEERLAGLRRTQALLSVTSPITGTIVGADPAMQPPRWVGRRDVIAQIVQAETTELRGYLSEDDLGRISTGSRGIFVPDDPVARSREAKMGPINQFAAAVLDPGYHASTNGGRIPVEAGPKDELPKPYGSWFQFTAGLVEEASPTMVDEPVGVSGQVQRGVLVLEGRSESWMHRAFVQVARVLVREFNA